MTDDQLHQLIQLISGLNNKFGGLEQRFDGLEQRFGGLEKNFEDLNQKFDRLSRYTIKGFVDIRIEFGNEFDKLNSRVDSVYNLLDDHLKNREIDQQERLAMASQLTRHDGWINQLANHTHAKLAPQP